MDTCSTCGTSFNIDFCPITIGAECIWVGFSATIEVTFVDPADISGDTFTATVKDSAGATVDTLTIGDGIAIAGTNILRITIETPVTDVAGKYKLTVIWTPASTGAAQPFSQGIIKVIPVP